MDGAPHLSWTDGRSRTGWTERDRLLIRWCVTAGRALDAAARRLAPNHAQPDQALTGACRLSDALTSRRHPRPPARCTPGPSQVHARSITGHRGPARPGAFRSGSGPVTGHREPRHPDAGAARCPGRGGVPNHPPVSARYQRKFRPGARRSGWAARAFRRILRLSAGRTQELPVTSRAPAGLSPAGRLPLPRKRAVR
jgi:hypothetical protein